jgi:uncharacterized protein (DUF58 family)
MILLIAMPVVSFICTFITSRNLSISLGGASDNIYLEEPFLMSLTLDNKSFFPNTHVEIEVLMKNELFDVTGSHKIVIPAYGRGVNTVNYQLSQSLLGVLNASVISVKISDWFGFVSLSCPIKAEKDFVVYPNSRINVEPDMTAMSLGMSEMEESKKKGYDFSEVTDVREYQPGDKLQNIHWKLSAKKDLLMVKERVSMSSSQLIILVELINDGANVLNDILKATYGISEFLVDNQLPFTLCHWSEKLSELEMEYVDTREELNSWMEKIYYEKNYSDSRGKDMLLKSFDEEKKVMVISTRDMAEGETVFTYGSNVEGYITTD